MSDETIQIKANKGKRDDTEWITLNHEDAEVTLFKKIPNGIQINIERKGHYVSLTLYDDGDISIHTHEDIEEIRLLTDKKTIIDKRNWQR
jgi:hypothetical protein